MHLYNEKKCTIYKLTVSEIDSGWEATPKAARDVRGGHTARIYIFGQHEKLKVIVFFEDKQVD
jgi:hypothetical protein